jgi:hypothetical protein
MVEKEYKTLHETYLEIYEAKADNTLQKPIQRSEARTERAGGDEPSRMMKHFLSRGVKKRKGLKEENIDNFIEYILDEGYADSEEDAAIILNTMSDYWFESILESTSKLNAMKPSEIKPHRQQLESQWKEIVNQVMKTSDPTEKAKLGAKAKNLKSQIDSAKKEETFHKSLPKNDNSDSDLTPEQLANRRKVQKATYGSTPQTPKYGEKAAPTRQTRAQSEAEREANRRVGDMDPTYYNRETGRREPIKAVGSTEVNYGGRGSKRVTGRYQQGATGSGTQSPTPAGSTIDPTRRRLRGTGRTTGQG